MASLGEDGGVVVLGEDGGVVVLGGCCARVAAGDLYPLGAKQ